MKATIATDGRADVRRHASREPGAPLLRVRGLTKTFRTQDGSTLRALDSIDLDVAAGEVRAIVGESGSGKTTLARCILRLVVPDGGSVEIDGRDVSRLSSSELRRLRREVQVVFQDPVGSLDPRMRVRDLIAEPLRVHQPDSRSAIDATVADLLTQVGLGGRHLDRRPHELSGGQCQRVAIARAIALRPKLLVLDEPTSALDVSVQAQILNLLVDLRERYRLTYVLISHDLGVVRHLADRVSVMYLGRLVEGGAANGVFARPTHPYTRALLAASPDIDGDRSRDVLLRGDPPSAAAPPTGCRFHPRCWLRDQLGRPEICEREEPPRVTWLDGAACHFPEAAAAGPTSSPSAAPSATLPAQGAVPVTLANWQDPPFIRWSYRNIDAVLPTARIARGSGPTRPLAEAPDAAAIGRRLEALSFDAAGTPATVSEMLATTSTDGFLVVHDGAVVLERYDNDMTATSRHLLQSVSKSMTGALAGALVGEGRLAVADLVTDHVPELRGTSFEGCTVEHLLDMRAGTRFNEDYDDLEADVRLSEQVSGWRPRSRPDLPAGLYEYIATLGNARPHGGVFEYRSILTNLLGWVLERASGQRFAEAFSTRIWGPLGAEDDGLVTVDATGAAVEDGGISVTLRDLARFGLMYLDGGVASGRQVLPGSWVDRLRAPSNELIAAFRGPFSYQGISTPELMYHDQWWVLDPSRGIHVALGIHGQMLYVHPPSRTVIAKVSTQPLALDRRLFQLQLSAAQAIADHLGPGASTHQAAQDGLATSAAAPATTT